MRFSEFTHPRDFRHLWTASAFGHLGAEFTWIAVPVVAVNHLNVTAMQMGILTMIFTGSFLVLGLPAGAWVDRMSKRRVLIVSDLVRALALGAIAAAILFDAVTLPMVYLATAIVGIGTVFFDVAHQSIVPSLTGLPRVGEGNAALETTASVAQVAGPALAGQLLRWVSAGLLVGINSVLYLISTLALRGIRVQKTPQVGQHNLMRDIREGLSFVFRERLLVRMVLAAGIGNFAWSLFMALEALYILRTLGLSEATLGLIFSIGALGGLTGALATPAITRWTGPSRIIPLAAIGMALPTILLPLAGSSPRPALVLATGLFLTVFAMIPFNIATVSYRQRICPPELLGRMNASVRFLVWGTMPLGAGVGGVLASQIGVVPAVWFMVAGTFLAAVPVLTRELWSNRVSFEPAGSV